MKTHIASKPNSISDQ